jgi:hypothetical protein
MTTTCQEIIARARSFSILNTALTSDTAEMLSRIRADQRELRAMLAAETRDFFQSQTTKSSNAAASGRVVSIAALTPPLERILKVELLNGTEVNQVDVIDPDAELAPRYIVRGQNLIEWRNEWDTGSANLVRLTITYVGAPTDISPTGALTQTVSIPDEWTDLLALPLAAYCVHKDAGRDTAEYDRLMAMNASRRTAFLEYLQHYGGIEARRFDVPAPAGTKK